MSRRSIHTRQSSDFAVTPIRRDSADHLGHDLATAIFQDEWSENISLHTIHSHETATNEANGISHDKENPQSKPNITKPKSNSRQSRLRWCRGWQIELLSLMVAWGILAAVVVLLHHYKGKQLYETPARPSLNTIINILSTAFTALVMLATTAVLGQSKWGRYRKSQLLGDLGKIDAATRGPRGAIAVFFSPRLGIIVLSGAVIVLSTVGVGPMLQETVKYKTFTVPDLFKNSTTPIAQVYNPPGFNLNLDNQMDLPMMAAILDGLLAPTSRNNEISFNCPTGNCTFANAYTSTAVCHTCTEQPVSYHCSEYEGQALCNYTLSNGHFMSGNQSSMYYAINVSTLYEDETSQDYWQPLGLATVNIISLTNEPDCVDEGNPLYPCNANGTTNLNHATGAVCNLFFCSKTYVANISENSIDEKVIAITPSPGQNVSARIWAQTVQPQGAWAYNLVADPCYVDGIPHTLDQISQLSREDIAFISLSDSGTVPGSPARPTISVPEQCVYLIYTELISNIGGWMSETKELLDGSGSMSNVDLGGANPSAPREWAFGNVWGVQSLFNKGNASFASFDAAFESLATAMTNQIRQSGNPANATSAPGILLQLQIKVVIQWYWLILPIACVFTSSIYLATAIIFERSTAETKDWKWKSNPLPLLGLTLKSRSGEPIDLLSSEEATKKAARKIKMRLIKVDNGWEFVEEQSISSTSEEEGLRDAVA